MGWTEYQATEYTRSGKISLVREIRKEVKEGLLPAYEFVDDAMVGTTYYVAIREKETGRVFCAVYLTGTRDNYWFGYKGIPEHWKPCQCKCPDKILDQLTPTDDEWTNEWRDECREYNRSLSSPTAFKNLPDGATAKWEIPFSFGPFEKGTVLTLRKGRQTWRKRSPFVWHIVGHGYYVRPSMVGNRYEVIGG